MEKGKKLAVLVGCNYPNTPNELHGCHNDVRASRDMLVARFGFDPTHIELLTDEDDSSMMPTGANIIKALDKMVDQAEPGDILFFHYSGHGTLLNSRNSLKREEAIVPCDFNLITSVDFRHLVNRLPKGTSFTILSDSCHSGGLIDKEKEQIGPLRSSNTEANIPLVHKPKFIPFESILQHLSSLTNINTSDIGTHLLEIFGPVASLMFRLPRPDPYLDPNFSTKPLKPDEGILLSGCQTDETSADVQIMENGGKACGAFSNAVQMVLKENSGPLSNKQLVMMARKILKMQGFKQHPCLYCSDYNADAIFLCQAENRVDVFSMLN
ncbi:Metacaspase-9 [Forsythia ovata]|uniref:Metacaspase-9 n=1 Tax=Forsythia ovata TaxID=205694 RepID=A0ABD1R3D1_9LAMI